MMAFKFALACVIFGIVSSLSNTFNKVDQHRITGLLQEDYNDLKSIYYAVTALGAIGKTSNNGEKQCQIAFKKFDKNLITDIFQVSEIVTILKCKNVPKIEIESLLNKNSDSVDFSRAVIAMVNLKYEVSEDLVKRFVQVGREDDTPLSAASLFYAASVLTKSVDLIPIVAMVEDILAQADEINSEHLQFEGGLAVTSQIVRGILKLADQQGKPLMKQDQIEKFSAYFINRKYVYTLKDIHHLTAGLSSLSKNKHQVPVVVSIFNSNLISKENPLLKVRVTNLLDESIQDVSVVAKSFSTADDSGILFENKPFVKSPEKDDYIIIDGEVARGYFAANSFSIDLMSAKPSRGMFKCDVGVTFNKDKQQYVSKSHFTVELKVLSRIIVENVAVAVGDKDQVANKQKSMLKFPDRLNKQLEADYHQKLVMTFDLKDLHSEELVTVHQTFIRLVHEKTGQEIFFVSEPDSDDHYKFTLDVGATAKDSFNNLSGMYKMSLIVGDATMQVPISWTFGNVVLSFDGLPKTSKRQERDVNPKPIIEHMFRIPEKRPPKVVSIAFTVLVLSPLLVMFAMWFKIGANLSNFKFSLPTLLFHVGLASVFVLYYMFWIQYDMFKTMKLLSVLGGLTFLGGNRMLADMAASKYQA